MPDKSNLWVSWLGIFAAGWDPKMDGWQGGCITNRHLNEARCREFFTAARYYGANGCRIFPYECKWVLQSRDMFSPVQWDPVQQAWDLRKYNPEYFEALDKIVEIAEANNIRICYSLFDNCQRHRTSGEQRMAPWLNNVQGVTSYVESIPLSRAWVDAIVGRYGNRIDYEICNECVRWDSVADTSTWLAAMADHLIQSDVPPGNICWGAEPIGAWVDDRYDIDEEHDLTVQACRKLSNMIDRRTGKRYRDTLPQAQDLLWCTIHNIGIFPRDRTDEDIAAQCWGGLHTRKFIASTDGQSQGSSKMDCEEDGSWRRGNETETRATCAYLFAQDGGKQGKVTIELLPSNTAPAAWLPGLAGAVAAYRDRYGTRPGNYGTPDPVYPEPEPVDPPEPIPPPVPPVPNPEPEFDLAGEWANNKWMIIVLAVIVMLFLIAIF